MTLIIACGTAWRIIKPAGLSAEQTRPVLTTVVYYVFLPALVLEVLWSASLGRQTLEFSLLGVVGILSCLVLIILSCRLLPLTRPQRGAIILATAFPNVTYLGLPVLEQTFGRWARSVAIQLDLFAAAPLVFSVGIMIARHYGKDDKKAQAMFSFLITPPFLAAFLAVSLNLNEIEVPVWLAGVLQQLSSAVVPLMLFSLGLALSWQTLNIKKLPFMMPVIGIKLFLMPLIVMAVLPYLTMSEDYKAAAVLDMAMPSMVLGIVFCDRYKLDSALYAMAVTLTTLCSMVSLPFWFSVS